VALLALLGRPSPAETPTRQAVRLLCGAEALEERPTSGERAPDAPSPCLVERPGRLDARRLATTWADGRDAEVGALIEHVLRATEPHPPSRGGARKAELLTAREREVAGLIGRGHTNRRIAEALVVTERTAETHARNIREKLGFATRAQVAAWAATQGLVAVEA
jgi:DNA-binding CsgD family transcriptional regulator